MAWYGSDPSNPGGGVQPGAPDALEFSWIEDSNGTHWFLEIDEQTGDVTYYDQPGGTPGTPVGSVKPIKNEAIPDPLNVREIGEKLIPNNFDEINVTSYWNGDDRFPETIQYKLDAALLTVVTVTYTANGGIDNISSGLPV